MAFMGATRGSGMSSMGFVWDTRFSRTVHIALLSGQQVALRTAYQTLIADM